MQSAVSHCTQEDRSGCRPLSAKRAGLKGDGCQEGWVRAITRGLVQVLPRSALAQRRLNRQVCMELRWVVFLLIAVGCGGK